MPTSSAGRPSGRSSPEPNFDIHASPIRPERIVADCQAVLPPDAILACDVGVNHNWYMQFWKARRPQTMLNSWGFSGMGFGAAGVLGAKLAAPDRPCVAIAGDGCFTMVPARAVHRGGIRHPRGVGDLEQLRLGLDPRHSARACSAAASSAPCSIPGANKTPYNPDFAGWAKASGVDALTITKSEDFKGALGARRQGQQAVLDRRACRCRGAPARHRHLAAAADAAQGARVRQALGARRRPRPRSERATR